METSTSKINYSRPNPFTLPVVEERRDTSGFFGSLFGNLLPPILIPREGLELSSKVIEEIMLRITQEYQKHGLTPPQWKRYFVQANGNVTSEVFNPTLDGANIAQMPMEFFPKIVEDIQVAIDALLEDDNVPDSRGSYLARIFANNTTLVLTWDNFNKLPASLKINSSNGGQETILPQNLAAAGEWPFSVSTVQKIVNVKGVSSTEPSVQNVDISQSRGDIEVTDPNFPQSPYGNVTPSGVPGTKGIKMRSSDLTVWDRRNVSNSSQGVGAGQEDPDMGYGYIYSVPHIIHQLRYQPPSIETFPNNIAVQQYASNLFSNQTPNLPWVLSLPVETQIAQNLGFWLIKGNVGVQGNAAFIRAFNNPSAAAGAAGQCPFSVFFPPPTANCACGTGDSAYFIWHSSSSGFTWNQLALFQSAKATPRFIGRNTRMRLTGTTSGDAGSGDTTIGFVGVGIRTARISNVNLQPFHYVIRTNVGSAKLNPNLPNTGFNVNIMEEMNRIHGAGVYDIGGLDAIEAIQILVQTSSSANWTCDTEDGPGGSFLPASCFSVKTCSAGDLSLSASSLDIYEPNLVGDPVSAYT